ncbi:unnamed protein product [Phytomonas sp. EM1]|nr:unnamed protein product [Phytomonas sp. EM1]|eukprot:CCW65076.1 unnamed protein product [Phytomonas sp. isolate EM1]
MRHFARLVVPARVAYRPLPCHHLIRFIHERPFPHVVQPELASEESYEIARDALLQLNIMIRRGIEPDALMYTSLINIMGRAGLEWQAYKLFSRMIESNVHPLPETYVALRDATAKHRARLRDEIQAKIEQSMETFPEYLSEVELARQRDEDRKCIARFEEYMQGKLPTSVPPSLGSVESTPSPATELHASATSSATTSPSSPAKIVSTMHIRNPTDAWATSDMAEKIRNQPHQLAKGLQAESLRVALLKLDDEELRIYLATQRQLRHGSKQQLVDRILENVSENAISAMLGRRAHYFRSVEKLLAADLCELKGTAEDKTNANQHNRQHEAYFEADRTLRKEEQASAAPEILLTPWGLIRKPLKVQYREDSISSPSFNNSERLERIRLLESELMLLWRKSQSQELDEIPESLLRRYAYQFQLRWRRRVPLSLIRAVEWHARMFLPTILAERGGTPGDADSSGGSRLSTLHPLPTPPARLREQQEADGMRQTLENFEAFRIISQRTNNLQVVDDKEINLHIKRIRRDIMRKERKDDDHLRREGHILSMASLASSAREFTPMDPPEEENLCSIIGLQEPDAVDDTMRLPIDKAPSSPEKAPPEQTRIHSPRSDRGAEGTVSGSTNTKRTEVGTVVGGGHDELPPWALFSEGEEYNLSTGHFGDPVMGRYQELSNSKFRLLPSRLAEKKWSVDRHLLPDQLRDVVDSEELKQTERLESVEKEYCRRLEYKRYRKWDNLLRKAQAKAKAKGAATIASEGKGSVKPLPAQKRLAQLLRNGHDRAKVSESLRERFNRSL